MVSFGAWKFAVAKTVESYAQMNALNVLLSEKGNLPLQRAQLDKKAKALQLKIGRSQVDLNEVRLQLVSFCDSIVFNSSMEVASFLPMDQVIVEGFEMTVHQIIVSGNYADLERLSLNFDTEFDLGRLASVSYKKEFNRKKREDELYAVYTIQNIQSN